MMMLDEARPGDRAIVESLRGLGKERRLLDLGIIPGTEIQVIASHPFHGPIVVRASGTAVAVGRGLARSIPIRLCGRN